jgi:hypothetical protein
LISKKYSSLKIAYGGHVCKHIGMKLAIFIENLPWCFLPSFGSFGHAVSEEKILSNWPIRNKNCPWPNEPKLGWKVLYKDCSFRCDLFSNMAATGNSCF